MSDLLAKATELNLACSFNQPRVGSRPTADADRLRDLDEFSRSPLEDEGPVNVEGLPELAPLEDPEPEVMWPERLEQPLAGEDVPESSELQGVIEEVLEDLDHDWSVGEREAPEAAEHWQVPVTAIPVETSEQLTDAVPPAAPEVQRYPEPAPSLSDAPPAPRRNRRRAALIGAVAIAAVVVAALAVVALRGGGGDSTASEPRQVSLELPPAPIGTDVEVDAVWKLSGTDGDRFKATLTFSNRSSSPAQVTYQEVIPKALASSVDDITFLGSAPTVVQADPVVEYVVDIPAQSDVAREYEIRVAPDGVDRSRLTKWQDDLDQDATKRSGSLTTTTTAAPPTLPPENQPETAPTTAPRQPATTRRGTQPTQPPTNPPITDPPPTEPPPTEPPITEPPITEPPTTEPPTTRRVPQYPPTTPPTTSAPPTTSGPPTSGGPTTSLPPGSAPPTRPPNVPGRQPLAVTGSETEPLLWAGIAALAVGAALVVGAKRRRSVRRGP